MHRIHHHLCKKSATYHRWHQHPLHPHVHWGVLGAVVLGVALSFVILGWSEMEVTNVQVARAQVAAKLIFNSGFEADSQVVGYGDIAGIDHSVSAPNDWDLNTWDYDFNYVGGNSNQRRAEIVDDPTGAINPKTGKVNRALRFWMREAPLGTGARTRVAAQIHTLDRTEWFNRRRIYVHPDMSLLSDFPGSSRVMFEEIKVITTSQDPHFRITLVWANLGKSNFVWEVTGQDFRNQDFWQYQSRATLPIGEWFTAETYYKGGDNNTGRYVFAIQREGQPKKVLFDVTDWTHHPDIALAPADTWNPQKLYMSGGDDVDWIRNKGGTAQLYFDNWEVWSTSPGGGGGSGSCPTTCITMGGDTCSDSLANATELPACSTAYCAPNYAPKSYCVKCNPGATLVNDRCEVGSAQNQPPRNLVLRYLGPTPTGGNLCGNPPGRIDPGEQCDGTNLNGQTCQSLGFQSGTPACYPPSSPSACQIDTSSCSNPPTQVCGFFNEHSTWCEKIPANFRIMTNSSNYVDEIRRVSSAIYVVSRDYGVPIWQANSSDPVQAVVPYSESSSLVRAAIENNGFNKNVPVPPEAKPADGNDGHMVILSADGRYAWDFYQANRNTDGTLSTTRIKRWDLSSDGIDSARVVNGVVDISGQVGGNTRVAPVPLLHGLITKAEIDRGQIDHALAFVTESAKENSIGVYPAITTNSGLNAREWALKLGFRIQLDPRLNIDALGLGRTGKIIARAMQEYGMIFVENGGLYNNSVFAEDLVGKSISWEAGIAGVLQGIPLNRLRVIEPLMPPF